MNVHFISFKKELEELLSSIVVNSSLHGLWLNTLSYLENVGARKIASCEHPTLVKEEMLKHAAEEFRHAFYLKTQLSRLSVSYENYERSSLLGGWPACHYLHALDVSVSRYLQGISERKELAYLLVTYGIELRASELYPVYHKILRSHHSKIQVQSILLEEKEHLREMEEGLSKIHNASFHIQNVCRMEGRLFQRWLLQCSESVRNFF